MATKERLNSVTTSRKSLRAQCGNPQQKLNEELANNEADPLDIAALALASKVAPQLEEASEGWVWFIRTATFTAHVFVGDASEGNALVSVEQGDYTQE